MPFNGSGLFTRVYNWVVDRDASVKITAVRMDTEMDGMATGLSTCITKDGQTTITANIPFNGKKITGLGAGASSGDAVTFGQIGTSVTTTQLTVNGASGNAEVITATGTGSGTFTGASGFGFAYDHTTITQGLDTSGSTGTIAYGRLVEVNPANSSKSNVIAGADTVTVASGASIDTSVSTLLDFVGHQAYAKVSQNLGGTNLVGGEKGGIFAANDVAINNTTNVVGVIGREIDVQTMTGATQVRRLGITSVAFAPSASAGSTYDAAYHVGASGGITAPWKNGLLFSAANGGNPMDTTNGALVATQGSATTKYGVNLSSYTFTTAAFQSNGFVVNGSGAITSSGGIGTSNGLNVSAGGASITGGLTVTNTGLGVTAGGINVTAGGIGVTAGGLTVSAGTATFSSDALVGTALPNITPVKLSVGGTSASLFIAGMTNTHATVGDLCMAYGCGPNSSDSSSVILGFYNSGFNTLQGYIGRAGAANVAYITTSDKRMKNDIKPLAAEVARDKIDRLQVVDYVMLTNPFRNVGVLAQDAYEVFPEMIGKGDETGVAYGEEGFREWGVDYSRPVPLLIRAVQDIYVKLDGVIKRLDAMSGTATSENRIWDNSEWA